ncbi:PKD domain-containing protein [Micromonospora cremea]|uniref:PKD domain-containing protein n=1 Tax=Micromonospora cremea TaxID=709881 RepID=UPI00117E54BC|nr:PKD domain-containing protein [Micromonospora cremea]
MDPGTSCVFSDSASRNPTITCNDSGTFIATVVLDDGVSTPVTAQTKVIVRNDPPQVSFTTPTPWQLFRVGEPVVFDAPITDSGSNDVHRCQYGWDDGEAWDEQFDANGRNCGVTHTYEHAGMYTVDLVVTDDDLAQGSTSVMIVVYDPNEGPASIAGSTATPTGALATDPNASGETSVHYAAQYPMGGRVPVTEVNGQTLAWVDGTSFRLQLEAMEWFVITEDGKVAGRGTSTVDGKVGYTWVLYGWDYCDGSNSPGCQNIPSDKIRLVVFESATGKVVYDHSPGSNEFDVDRISPTVMNSGAVRVRRSP